MNYFGLDMQNILYYTGLLADGGFL